MSLGTTTMGDVFPLLSQGVLQQGGIQLEYHPNYGLILMVMGLSDQ